MIHAQRLLFGYLSQLLSSVEPTFIPESKMKVSIVALLCVAAAVAIEIPRLKRQASTYLLPDGVDLIIGPIKSTFSCDNRIYGYYADVDNDCRIFHVCLPITDDTNEVKETAIYSFACGNQTVFDQQHLVCVHAEDFTECGGSANVYDRVNSRFGVIEP